MQSLKKYLIEDFLIVFSVLFALYIDNYKQEVKTEKQKKLAVGRIQLELQRNDTITKEWVGHHNKILNNLNRLLTLSEEKFTG
jgi:hypothetical protein